VAHRKQVGGGGAGGGAGDGQQAVGKTTLAALRKMSSAHPPPISVINIYFQQASAMSFARATTMELNRTEEKRICIIGPLPSEKGGVSRSTLIIIYI